MSTRLQEVPEDEAKRLQEGWEACRRLENAAWAVGAFLRWVKDEEIYRHQYGTFEEAVRAEVGWSVRRAQQLITATDVREEVADVLDVSNERQARALAAVPDAKRREVAERVAGQQAKVTAAAIKAAAKRIAEEEEAAQPAENGPARRIDVELLKEPYQKSLRELNVMKRELKRIAGDQTQGIHLSTDISSIETKIDNLKGAIRQKMPQELCPHCDGEGCDRCKTAGWITRAIHALWGKVKT